MVIWLKFESFYVNYININIGFKNLLPKTLVSIQIVVFLSHKMIIIDLYAIFFNLKENISLIFVYFNLLLSSLCLIIDSFSSNLIWYVIF